MRSITRQMFRILNNEKLQPVQFLDIHFVGTSASMHLTDHGEQVTWSDRAYVPISMNRNGIEEVLSSEGGESPQSTIQITNIDLQMADVLNSFEINGAMATLWLADRRLMTRRRDALLLAQGEISDPQLTPGSLVCQIVNVIGLSEKLTIPRRLYQRECNYPFGSRACGILLANTPYTLAYTAEATSTASYVDFPYGPEQQAGYAADLSAYWASGYVLAQSGLCATQARPIDHVIDTGAGIRFLLRYPFYRPISGGDSMIIRRGCRKTKDDCKARNNIANYGGYADVPEQNLKPVEVKG